MVSSINKTFDDGIKYIEKGEYKKAYEIFKYLASKNNVYAQMQLGFIFFTGLPEIGIKKDMNKAIFWFQKVKDEDSEIMRILALCYLEQGNLEKGIFYLENAFFDRKNKTAVINLGDIYRFGTYGITKNKEKALSYYTKGCIEKNYNGCRNIVILLEELGYDKTEYIKEHVGIFRFLFVILKGGILKCLFYFIKNK